MSTHLEVSLQQDIDRIRSEVVEMSALGETALKTCVQALTEKNHQLAYAVILRDLYIDEMEKRLDRLCLEFLVRQQPVASQLRFAFATIKIDLELERVGDYAESIARQTLKLLDIAVNIPSDWFQEIGDMSIRMLHDSVKAFAEQDVELAKRTIETEHAVDLLKSQINKRLVALFRDQAIPFEALSPLMMIVRRFERVSDQARNICMESLYMCTGEYAKHPGADTFQILFVDGHNSCRGQIAEAIGNSLNLPRFAFASAGIEPRPIEPATVSFMKEKGFDMTCMVPKSINELPPIDHFHVVVALAEEVRRALPLRPRKSVFLDWRVADPSQAKGSPDDVRAAYQRTYEFIEHHLRDLAGALSDTGPTVPKQEIQEQGTAR